MQTQVVSNNSGGNFRGFVGNSSSHHPLMSAPAYIENEDEEEENGDMDEI